jgi:hypothetical protein
MKPKYVGLILAVAVALTGTTFGLNRGQAQSAAAAGQNRERVRDQLATLRLLRMTQALNLTEEQTGKMFPTINKLEKDRTDLHREISAKLRELRNLVKDPASLKDENVLPLLDGIKAGRDKVRVIDEQLETFIESNLTTVQKASYVLFNIDFMRSLTDVVNRSGQRGAGFPPFKKR